MDFKFCLPVDIRFGADAVTKNASALRLGKKALIVTGATSAEKCGALADCVDALKSQGISYYTFKGVGNNPEVEQCAEIAAIAVREGADFVIGIGGGSPMDAAKAIAVFASNPDISYAELFKNEYKIAPLPIVAIPTTSGTGSEVTPWSILTWHEIKTKRSFGSQVTFPTLALLDPKYTKSLPLSVTRHTAMDAFQHCFESMMSHKSTPISDALNTHALREFASCMEQLESGDVDPIREKLMLISMLGGCTISHTGTTHMHALGYPLTYYYGVPHGFANAMVMPVYLEELEKHEPERLQRALTALNMSASELKSYVLRNYEITINPSADELPNWAEQTNRQGSTKNTDIPNDVENLLDMFDRIFSGKLK